MPPELNADRKTYTARCRANRRAPFPLKAADVVDFVYAKSPPLVRADGELRVDPRSAGPQARSPGTVGRYLASIRALHRAAGVPDDPLADVTVEQPMRSIRRGAHRTEPRSPLQLSDVKRAFERPARSVWELRDRALVAVAYSALLRRSELVALELRDLERDPNDGSATIMIRRSKTDQQGGGEARFLAPYVVGLLDAWFLTAGIREGALFRGIRPDGNDDGVTAPPRPGARRVPQDRGRRRRPRRTPQERRQSLRADRRGAQSRRGRVRRRRDPAGRRLEVADHAGVLHTQTSRARRRDGSPLRAREIAPVHARAEPCTPAREFLPHVRKDGSPGPTRPSPGLQAAALERCAGNRRGLDRCARASREAWEIPAGCRNFSSKISPGWNGFAGLLR